MQLPLRNQYRGVHVPPGYPRIDWRHPFTIGLNFVNVCGSVPHTDLFTGRMVATFGGVTLGVGGTGPEAQFTNAAPATNGYFFAANQPRFLTSIPSNGTGDFTIAVIANPSSSASQTNCLLSQRNGANSNGQAALWANVDGVANTQSQGMLSLQTFNGTFVGANASGAIDGKYHVFVGTRSGTTCTLYQDGVSVGTGSGTAQAIWNVGASIAVGALSGGSSTQGANCGISLAMAWQRALSATDVAVWSADPTLFLLYPSEQIYAIINEHVAGNSSTHGSGGGHVPPVAPPPRPLVRSLASGIVYAVERRRRGAYPGSTLQKLPGQ